MCQGQGPSSSSRKQWKSDGIVKIYNSVSTKRHWHNPRKQKLWRALQYKKCVCQCTDGLSATQNGLGTAEDFSTLQESNQCLPILCDLLTHWFMSITRKKLLGIWLVVFHQFFCVQDCSTQIFQVEYQGQTQNTRILEHEPSIDTSYSIRHGWEFQWNIFT